MSETPVDHGTSEGRVLDWRTLIKLVMAVLTAALALLPVWVLFIPLWAVLILGGVALLILPFDQSFSLNNPSAGIGVPAVAGETLGIGALGALEGFLFWLVWRLLSGRRLPAERAAEPG